MVVRATVPPLRISVQALDRLARSLVARGALWISRCPVDVVHPDARRAQAARACLVHGSGGGRAQLARLRDRRGVVDYL